MQTCQSRPFCAPPEHSLGPPLRSRSRAVSLPAPRVQPCQCAGASAPCRTPRRGVGARPFRVTHARACARVGNLNRPIPGPGPRAPGRHGARVGNLNPSTHLRPRAPGCGAVASETRRDVGRASRGESRRHCHGAASVLGPPESGPLRANLKQVEAAPGPDGPRLSVAHAMAHWRRRSPLRRRFVCGRPNLLGRWPIYPFPACSLYS
jgi:hypothetical protein